MAKWKILVFVFLSSSIDVEFYMRVMSIAREVHIVKWLYYLLQEVGIFQQYIESYSLGTH